MEQEKEYFVFISYSSLDNEWAIWLRHELEHYHLPASFNGRTDVRDNLRKVFRDRDELNAGPEWDAQVQKALKDTNNLIVICSPNSAKSPAVNKEIETFIALGKDDHIFPFIVEGNNPKEYFPKSLKRSKVGGDVNKDGGRDSAFIKVVAGMLKVSYPSLWDRYEIEKAEEERKIREQRDKLLIMQSRFLAEKVNDLIYDGNIYLARRLIIEVLPADLSNPNRPYTVEAESCLRRTYCTPLCILYFNEYSKIVELSPDGHYLVFYDVKDNLLQVLDSKNGKYIQTIGYTDPRWIARTQEDYRYFTELLCDKWHYHDIEKIAFSYDNKYILSLSSSTIIVVNELLSGKYICRIESGRRLENVAFSIDGRFIIGQDSNKEIIAWDTVTGHPIDDPTPKFDITPSGTKSILYADFHSADFLTIANKWINRVSAKGIEKIYTYDDKHIAFSTDKNVGVFNMQYYSSLIYPVDHSIAMNDIPEKDRYNTISSPSKNVEVTIHGDDYVKWLEVKNANGISRKLEFKLDYAENIETVLFSPNEEYLVCVSGMNPWLSTKGYFHEIWDITSCNLLCKIEGQYANVRSLSFHPNSQSIASISDNNSIKVFDVHTGILLVEYPFIANKTIEAVSFSEDGRVLYAQATDKNTYAWSFDDLQVLIDETRERFKDNPLTSKERKKYYLD